MSMADVCALNLKLVRWIGFNFETCTANCHGAAVTDIMIAVHALSVARRIWRRGHRGESATRTETPAHR